jgi:hypothetical protein
VAGIFEEGKEHSRCTKCGKILDKLRNYCRFKQGYTPRSYFVRYLENQLLELFVVCLYLSVCHLFVCCNIYHGTEKKSGYIPEEERVGLLYCTVAELFWYICLFGRAIADHRHPL